VTGCTEVSPDCDHCYARTFAERWRGVPGHPYEQGFDVRLWPQRLELPLRWRKAKRVFVNSMSDLLHAKVPAGFLAPVWAVMALTPQHTYQILTKRPERYRHVLDSPCRCGGGHQPGVDFRRQVEGHALRLVPGREVDLMIAAGWPLANVWLGTSIESDYVWRADALRAAPAAVRFLSLEPLLGPLPSLDLARIDWVIVGGESGPGSGRWTWIGFGPAGSVCPAADPAVLQTSLHYGGFSRKDDTACRRCYGSRAGSPGLPRGRPIRRPHRR
jgi:protein gp37